MALTFTPRADQINQKAPNIIGDLKMWIGTITFDASYITGGELISKSDVGFDVAIDAIIGLNSQLGNRVVVWDPATKKIRLYTALGTEAANASDQSTIVVNAVVIGR
jgi:hypothetical protein